MARPFHELLAELGGGDFTDRAGEVWAELVRAAAKTGDPATMTVTFTVEQVGDKFQVETKIKTRKPYPPIAASGFYADENGNLTTNQISLGFKVTPIRGGRDPKGSGEPS